MIPLIINNIFKNNIEFVILFIIIFIMGMKFFSQSILLLIIIIILLVVYHKDILKIIDDHNKKNNKIERTIENNKRTKKEKYTNDKLDSLMNQLKKYRKYNIQSYEEGMKYMNMFLYIINDLENKDISHPRQYFENAQLYLKKSLNYFQSITISVPEENFIESLKYNKYESNKLLNKVGKLCKKINTHCYHILYNLSLRFDENFYELPNTYKTLIEFNNEKVVENNSYDNNYELY
jgi:ABC-type multidrug transport system fused ATPase/permease subunit